MTMKVAIVGSRSYTNSRKIQDFVFKLKEGYGKDLEIVSGGCGDGADKYAKKFALEFDVKYSEFPPVHKPHNIHCVNGPYKYNKPFYKSNYHKRNEEIAKYSDKVVAFCPEGKVTKGTGSALKYCEKNKKKYIIID